MIIIDKMHLYPQINSKKYVLDQSGYHNPQPKQRLGHSYSCNILINKSSHSCDYLIANLNYDRTQDGEDSIVDNSKSSLLKAANTLETKRIA